MNKAPRGVCVTRGDTINTMGKRKGGDMISRCAMGILLGVAVLSSAAAAQSADPTLSATGSAAIEKMPEIMRMKIDIPASGPDIEQALAKLKQKRESAVKKLKDMGAAEDAIKVEPPNVTPDPTEAMKRQMMMMRGQMEEEEQEEEKDAKPAKVSVTLALKVEWPLKSDDPEAMLIAVHGLQQKIRGADLAGLKEEKLTEEELEEQAEMQERMPRYSSDEEPTPGEPGFLFVWKVSDADHAKLLADAFAAAKADAEKLAAAAGVQLGSLASLSGQGMGGGEEYGYAYGYTQAYYQMMRSARGMMSADEAEKEAMGVLPQKISKRVNVRAAYKIK